MENESREETINLATLCMNLYEDIERKQGIGQRRIKPLPKDNAFDNKINNNVLSEPYTPTVNFCF